MCLLWLGPPQGPVGSFSFDIVDSPSVRCMFDYSLTKRLTMRRAAQLNRTILTILVTFCIRFFQFDAWRPRGFSISGPERAVTGCHSACVTDWTSCRAFGPGRSPLFSRSYNSEGDYEAGKMLGAGAFGQKSAVRQSSLDAFKRVFEQLRPDIEDALRSPETAAP